jgi:hypothetical protein
MIYGILGDLEVRDPGGDSDVLRQRDRAGLRQERRRDSLVHRDRGDRFPQLKAGYSESPSGSTYCAPENGLCAFTGSRTVAYGAGTTFTQKSLTAGTPCTNAVFVDPQFGVVKSCFLMP